jgi:hypothetical protein
MAPGMGGRIVALVELRIKSAREPKSAAVSTRVAMRVEIFRSHWPVPRRFEGFGQG